MSTSAVGSLRILPNSVSTRNVLPEPVGPTQQEVRLARQLGAVDAVDVDPLDPADVAVRHQAQRAPRRVLAAVAVLLERLEHRLRRRARQLAHELDEVLEPLLADLAVRLHPSIGRW